MISRGMKSFLFYCSTFFIDVEGFFLQDFSEANFHTGFVGVSLAIVAKALKKIREFITVFIGSISEEVFLA